ncbi:MAG: M28 family peptidase [Pseudarcicella sp.]|nr:M28 family peptidase [Pseudarcicella sp.]MBP6409840.1 M28 family peptidase [Pseudarcicella sp.]
MNKQRIAILLLIVFALSGSLMFFKNCEKESSTSDTTTENTLTLVAAPNFDETSAYNFISEQIKFGPRVPNSQAHKKCGDWLIEKFKTFGTTVQVQEFKSYMYDGKALQSRNIIASYNPSASKRILLAAHWDTRSIADKDSVNKKSPIDGANDGGSGVAILLEIANAIQQAKTKPNVGIDFILFDAEDTGEPEDFKGQHQATSWCLGSQYWAANKHIPNYSAYYGILLDMVGAKNAIFPREGSSMQYAPEIVKNIWKIGQKLGYNAYFIDTDAGGLTDDHVAVNEIGKIQMIDIIELHPERNDIFGSYHHKHSDNINSIDKKTLKAVGQTVLQTLYQE